MLQLERENIPAKRLMAQNLNLSQNLYCLRQGREHTTLIQTSHVLAPRRPLPDDACEVTKEDSS